jgi:predicted nucleic acid-binding protein
LKTACPKADSRQRRHRVVVGRRLLYEADNHLIELAVAGGADLIVTRNLRDIQRGELQFPHLRFVSPEDFLKEI